jgi:hypothetical protein
MASKASQIDQVQTVSSGTWLIEEKIISNNCSVFLALMRDMAQTTTGDRHDMAQRVLGYVVALHHQTDDGFVHHFVGCGSGAILAVNLPHLPCHFEM